eukprot:GSChrysophyteH1.ASY1.ANO1.3274.1 assembled CDS
MEGKRSRDDSSMPEMQVAQGLSIGIVGGGLGGLACALSLQQAGFTRVTVLEKDVSFDDRMQGYGLTLTNNPKGPLAKLGLLQECVNADCASHCHWVFNPKGEIIGYYGRCFNPISDYSSSEDMSNRSTNDGCNSATRGNLRVPRQVLRKMLLSKLRPNTVEWGMSLLSYEETESEIIAIFERTHPTDPSSPATPPSATPRKTQTQETIHFDLLIGSDGLRSAVRQLRDFKEFQHLPSPTPLQYLDVAVIIGLSTLDHPLTHNQGFYVLEGRHRLFTMPFRSQSSHHRLHMWQLSFSGLTLEQAVSMRTQSPQSLLEQALQRTNGWTQPVQQMLQQTPLKYIWGTALFDREPMVIKSHPKYNNGGGSGSCTGSRVTLIGDAAHPMSMFKGQGANQALEDGPLLTSWLLYGNGQAREQKVLLSRVRGYEREMRARSAPKQRASREAARQLHNLTSTSASDTDPLGIDFEDSFSLGFEGVIDQYKHIRRTQVVTKAQEMETLESVTSTLSSEKASEVSLSDVDIEKKLLKTLRQALQERKVTAACAESSTKNLENLVKECIDDLQSSRQT